MNYRACKADTQCDMFNATCDTVCGFVEESQWTPTLPCMTNVESPSDSLYSIFVHARHHFPRILLVQLPSLHQDFQHLNSILGKAIRPRTLRIYLCCTYNLHASNWIMMFWRLLLVAEADGFHLILSSFRSFIL